MHRQSSPGPTSSNLEFPNNTIPAKILSPALPPYHPKKHVPSRANYSFQNLPAFQPVLPRSSPHVYDPLSPWRALDWTPPNASSTATGEPPTRAIFPLARKPDTLRAGESATVRLGRFEAFSRCGASWHAGVLAGPGGLGLTMCGWLGCRS